MPKKDQYVSDDFQEVTTMNIHKLEIGEKVKGKFKGMRESHYGEQPVLQLEDGDKITLPNLTVLMTKFKEVDEGSEVIVKRLPDEKSEKSGRLYQNYSVRVRKA